MKRSSLQTTRVSRTLKRTPTRKQVSERNSSPDLQSVAKKRNTTNTITEEMIGKFVHERLTRNSHVFLPSPAPIHLKFESSWLHKCEDCGDAFLNEETFKQHVTRRTMKITVCDVGQDSEVYYNRCNFLGGMRKQGRNQQVIDKLNIKVEPLIKELSHKLSGGDIDLASLKKNSEEFYKQVQANIRTNKASSLDIIGSEANSQPRAKSGPIKSTMSKPDSNQIEPFGMKCPECDLPMATRLRLKQHLDFEGPEPKICAICHLPMPNKCSLKAHERLHEAASQSADHSFMCPDCGVQFLSRDTLLTHIHQDCMHGFLSATFQCPQCCKLLSSSISLEAHLLNEHTEKVYKCSICHLVESSPEDIAKHISQNHVENGRTTAKKVIFNNCELCPGRYIKSNDILFHVHKHAEEADSLVCYVCAPCNVYVETKEEFREHKQLCKQSVSKFSTLEVGKSEKPKSKQSSPDLTDEADSRSSTPPKKKMKSDIGPRRKSDEDLPPAKKNCIRCGGPTKATKNAACMYCRSSRVSVLSDDSPFKQRLTITQRGIAVEEIDTDAFEDAILGKKKADDIYNCYICKEKLVSKYGDVEHHFQEKHCINFTSKKINTKNFKVQLESMKNEFMEKCKSDFSCKSCLFKTQNETEFNRHLLEHKPLKPISYICKNCDISFAMKSCLAMHLEQKHKVTDTDVYLKDTDQMINRKESPTMKENQCRVCYKEFNTALEMNTHFRIHGMAFLLNKTRST
ncbi:zinc finger protein 532-like [Cloeon dipterum]|uniref:zinc finger protein 532-like n=1 Tax=Cloeon dipterum TaxID=197152 RepID=UPI0032201986